MKWCPFVVVKCNQNTFHSHNVQAKKTTKERSPSFSATLLCFVMECYSNPQLPWILCCMAATQNKNLLHCTLDAPTLIVLSDDEARNRKHPGSQFSWQALSQMSSDVGVCSRASGNGDTEVGGWGVGVGGGELYGILGFWMQTQWATVSLACLTCAVLHSNQLRRHSAGRCTLRPQHQSLQISFFWSSCLRSEPLA